MDEHKSAWSAAWGILALLFGGGALTWYLTARAPNSGLPIWLAYVFGGIALASLYAVFATLSGWWPWGARQIQHGERVAVGPVHADPSPVPSRPVSTDEDQRLERQRLGGLLLTELATNRERIQQAQRVMRGWSRNRALRSTQYREWARSRATVDSPANDALRRFYVWSETMNHRFADGEANEQASIGQVMHGPGLEVEDADYTGIHSGLLLLAQAEEALRTSLVTSISHGELTERVIVASLRLIDESQHGQIDDGVEVAHDLAMDPEDPALINAFKEAMGQGRLMGTFPGAGMLPVLIRRP